MKKSVAAYWVFALGVVLVTTTMCAEAKAQLLDRNLSVREIAFQLQTPEDVAHYLWHNFAFEFDQSLFGTEEHWQSPEEFLTTRKGDCEDFALFAREILRMNGIPAFLLNLYGGSADHTVCVFREGGKYHVIDGDQVVRYGAGDLRELASELDPFWKTGAIVTAARHSDRGRILTEFEHRLRSRRRFAASA